MPHSPRIAEKGLWVPLQPLASVSFLRGPRTRFEEFCAYSMTPSSWRAALCISLPSPQQPYHGPRGHLESSPSSPGSQGTFGPPSLPEDTDVLERSCLQLAGTSMKLPVSPWTGQPEGKDSRTLASPHTFGLPFHVSTLPCEAARRGQWRVPRKRSTPMIVEGGRDVNTPGRALPRGYGQ